jgi:hypothetical protein
MLLKSLDIALTLASVWLFKMVLNVFSLLCETVFNDDREFEENTLKSQLELACNHFNIKHNIKSMLNLTSSRHVERYNKTLYPSKQQEQAK